MARGAAEGGLIVAVRKETIKQQFNEALPAVLEPASMCSAVLTVSRGRTRCGPKRRTASTSVGGLLGWRGTLCYPGAVPGV